jgi:hypothetical protein
MFPRDSDAKKRCRGGTAMETLLEGKKFFEEENLKKLA